MDFYQNVMSISANSTNSCFKKLFFIITHCCFNCQFAMKLTFFHYDTLPFSPSHVIFIVEPWTTDHEEVGPLQHCTATLLLLLQWREGVLALTCFLEEWIQKLVTLQNFQLQGITSQKDNISEFTANASLLWFCNALGSGVCLYAVNFCGFTFMNYLECSFELV